MQRANQKRLVQQEIFETEGQYVSDLRTLILVWKGPLQAVAILPTDVIKKIFQNIDSIFEFHDNFLNRLQSGAEFCGLLQTHIKKLSKLYVIYSEGSDAAIEVWLQWLNAEKRLKSWQEGRSHECGGLQLKDFLIKPIQRLCKYPLLLKSLSEATDETAEDYPDIISALNKMNAALQEINSMKDAQVSFTVLTSLTHRILDYPGTLLKFGRKFLREIKVGLLDKSILTGEMNPNMKHLHQRAFSECPLNLLVFNDMIIFGKEKKDRIEMKRQIPMVDIIVVENRNDDSSFFLHLPKESIIKYRNNIVFVDKPAERNLLFQLLNDHVKECKKAQGEKSKADPTETVAALSNKLFEASAQSKVEVVNGLAHHSNIRDIVNIVSPSGETALHVATKKENLSLLIELLNIDGIDVNAVDADGSTALHLTTDPAITALLLSKGANQNLVNKAGAPAQESCALWCPHVLAEFEAKGIQGLYDLYPSITKKSTVTGSTQQPTSRIGANTDSPRGFRSDNPVSPRTSRVVRGLSVGRPRNISRKKDKSPERANGDETGTDDASNRSPSTQKLVLSETIPPTSNAADSTSPPSSPPYEKRQQTILKYRARSPLPRDPGSERSSWDPSNLLLVVKETEIKKLTEENLQLEMQLQELAKKYETLSKLQDYCPCGASNKQHEDNS